MRIGIDATSWSNWRGFGRFTRSLVSELLRIDTDNDYVLFFDAGYGECEELPPGGRHVVVPTSVPQERAITVNSARSWADLWRMSRAVARQPPDLFFSPSIDGYFPLPPSVRKVVAIHDTIPEEWGRRMLPRRRSRWRRWVKLRVALWQADRVVTGSEQVRAKVCRVFRLPPDRTGIVPYGAAAIFARPASRPAVQAAVMGRHGLTLPYLLHVGGFGPNKNLLALTEAFADVTQQPRFATVTLVFVGRREDDRDYPESQALDRLIERRDLGPRVRFVGRQDDRRLRDLYQGAEALVVASLEEGFGLPGLEATACGTPVIATIASPLPQVLGDAALPVDPRAPAALRQALEIVLGDASAQQRLRRAAAARGPALHWEQSARAALRIFEEVADGTARPRV